MRDLAADAEFARELWPDETPRTRKVRCRHCGQRNRVSVPRAVLSPERHECGQCRGRLFLDADEPLAGLSATVYQHGLDRRALATLSSLPGLPQLVRWSQEVVGERSARILMMSDTVRCDAEQFPELVALMERARHRLDLPLRPTLFLGESPHMNGMTTGVRDAIVVLRSALLDQMNDEELVAVLGHELGHLQADHPLYQGVATLLLAGGFVLSGAVRLLSWPLQRALLRWSRCAELTADRAALLASRSLRACIGLFLKFAGGSRPGTTGRTRIRLGPFIEQARELERMQSDGWLDGMLVGWLTSGRTHPFTAWRVMHLIHWVEHGNYLDLLAGDYRPRLQPSETRGAIGGARPLHLTGAAANGQSDAAERHS